MRSGFDWHLYVNALVGEAVARAVRRLRHSQALRRVVAVSIGAIARIVRLVFSGAASHKAVTPTRLLSLWQRNLSSTRAVYLNKAHVPRLSNLRPIPNEQRSTADVAESKVVKKMWKLDPLGHRAGSV
jgi:hypothetical protein